MNPVRYDGKTADNIAHGNNKKEREMTEAVEQRLTELREKLKARKGQKAFLKNCAMIETEILRLEALLRDT